MIDTFLRLLWMVVGAIFGGGFGATVGFVWAYQSSLPRARNVEEIYVAQDTGTKVGGLLGALFGALLVLLIVNSTLRLRQPRTP